MQYLKRFVLIVVVTILLLAGGFVFWAESAYPPQSAALAALVSDDKVTVTKTKEYIAFAPSASDSQPPSTGFILYPGGRVDYRAYAPVLHKIAEQGYFVALVPVRLNLAVFDLEAGAAVLAGFPQIQTWAAGGHSLGGAGAVSLVTNHLEVTGLVFFAFTPVDDSLKNKPVRVLSVIGSLDGLFSPENIAASRPMLPADSLFVIIEGGNHAQFGDYGFQKGDRIAAIRPEAQWQQAAQVVADFLQSLNR